MEIEKQSSVLSGTNTEEPIIKSDNVNPVLGVPIKDDNSNENVETLIKKKDYIQAISRELNKGAQYLNANKPDYTGIFIVRTANQTIEEASLQPNPDSLWQTFWYEGEVCCLFSDSNLGKSIYAVQIATEIAKSRRVLYFDFELSQKQFQLRYSDDEGSSYRFPDNLFRVEIDPNNLSSNNFKDALIDEIEKLAISKDAKVLIIDNLTYLCIASEKGDAAGELMMHLMRLKKKHCLSILVLAHTPKRPLSNPITQNDLAGSKKLYNFFDSVFAIGKSAKDEKLRYIKQLKVRYGEYVHDAGNVIVCYIEKQKLFLQFTQTGFAEEKEHLRGLTDKGRADLINEAKRLKSEGMSQREIAKQLNISLGCVNKYLKK